jgi:membrane-bound metal-dependent hydrolase YbcI (DUF457 family)
MFLGHFAVGLAGKKLAPKVSLGTLFLAIQFMDLLWPILVLIGIEHVRVDPGNTAFTPLDFYDYPFSHSLFVVLLWSALFGLVYYLARRALLGSLVLGAGVFSHWLLDFITHRPDLPLAPGSQTYFGLGLWNSIPAAMLVEGLLFLTGVIVYTRITTPRNRTGTWSFWVLVIFLTVIWAANIFSPPPPSGKAVASLALLVWLFIPWGYWIDRHRVLR